MKPYVSTAIRGVQLLFAVLTFILGCALVAKLAFLHRDGALAIVAGLFGAAFYIATLVPVVAGFLSPAIVLGLELWTWLWFLVAMATTANDFGAGSCDYFFNYYDSWHTGCQINKAIIGISVIAWLLSIVTLVSVIWFSVVPAAKAGSSGLLVRDYFVYGSIFPKNAVTVADPEAEIAVAESADPSKAEAGLGDSEEHIDTAAVTEKPVVEEEAAAASSDRV